MSASSQRPPLKGSPPSRQRAASAQPIQVKAGAVAAPAKRPALLGWLGQWIAGRQDRSGQRQGDGRDAGASEIDHSTAWPVPERASPPTVHADAIVSHSGMTPAAELSAVRDALRQMLAHHPQARTVVPHLAYVLHALREDGFAALKAAPKYVTKSALKQLDLLTGKALSPALNILRTRLIAVAFADEIEGSEGALSSLISAMDHSVGSSVSLSEATLEDFLAETEQWEATMRDPGPSTTPAHLHV